MNPDEIAKTLEDILPQRTGGIAEDLTNTRAAEVSKKVEADVRRKTARELAEIRLKEEKRLAKEKAEAERAGKEAPSMAEVEYLDDLEKGVLAGDAISASLPATVGARRALALQGTTRPEMDRLFKAIGINLDVRLTKADTANLLTALLTCNDKQLDAMLKNKKTPVVIKAVIRRIQADALKGDLYTIEHLWDRIFGESPLAGEPPAAAQGGQPGLLPDIPVSREAYVLIRENLLK